MSEAKISHDSGIKLVSPVADIKHEDDSKNGLKWTWKVSTEVSWNEITKKLDNYVYMSWAFNWDELRNEKGVEGLKGIISVKAFDIMPNYLFTRDFDVVLTRSGAWLHRRFHTVEGSHTPGYCFRFNHSFTFEPFLKSDNSLVFENIFAPSEFSDVALLIEGQKIHVNKAMLSIHSSFFRALFNSDFKEKSITEIPIEDVAYEEFATLLSLIYPIPVMPNPDNVADLLKLSDRFTMASVRKIAEPMLSATEHVKFCEMFSLADKYGMETLVKQCTDYLKSHDEIKELSKSSHFKELSDATKLLIFERSLSF
ncbi:unnamed protein product [Caenorhabditis sp. 36 PRJEB53466]|nr:unnamed protein product [Caenorhabditis sp. 36 PRJEB53466]